MEDRHTLPFRVWECMNHLTLDCIVFPYENPLDLFME